MSTTLVLMLVVAGAYLAAHVAFEWLARRFSVISGAEYVLLGILLGPEVAGLIRVDVVGGFAPFMTLALGWVGAVVGAQFSLPALGQASGSDFRVAFLEALLCLTAVAAAMVAAIAWLLPVTPVEALVPGVGLAAVATASAPSGIAMIRGAPGRSGPLARQLAVATAVDSVVAITALAALLAIAHPVRELPVRVPTATEWAVISVAIGAVGGVLFHLFLGREEKIDRLFIALAGALILVSGAAAHLRLSPLFPAMLVGFVLVNTSPAREAVQEVLGRVERPLYFVLLIFAGAAWQAGDVAWVVPFLFIAVRLGAKIGGGAVATALAGTGAVPAGWGRGLVGQGGLAIAVGFNYLVVGHPWGDTVFTAAILSVLLTDFGAGRFALLALGPGRRRGAPVREEG